MAVASDHSAILSSLVELAVCSDDPAALVAAAGAELERPLGLVDLSGAMLGRAPADEAGDRAVSIARAAARAALVAPPGWKLIPLTAARVQLGVLAAGEPDGADEDPSPLMHLVRALLTDQLRRAALVRQQRAAFVRRLVSSPPLAPHRARREAAELGASIADAYWPAVLGWRPGSIHPEAIETLEREARAGAAQSLTTLLTHQMVLLYPVSRVCRDEAAGWFEDVAARARALAPGSCAHAVAAERPADLPGLSGHVRHLAGVAELSARFDPDRVLTWASDYALEELLSGQVHGDAARRFVQTQLGPLISRDQERGTNLMDVLEAGLDFSRHDRAARQCFLHRNTFRHRFAQAIELLGDPLERPERRLAVHVAVKLHRLLEAEGGKDRLTR